MAVRRAGISLLGLPAAPAPAAVGSGSSLEAVLVGAGSRCAQPVRMPSSSASHCSSYGSARPAPVSASSLPAGLAVKVRRRVRPAPTRTSTRRSISFLAQWPPDEPDSDATSSRAEYSRLFLDALTSGSSTAPAALGHVETEDDVLALFERVNSQLGVPKDTLPPASAWAWAFQALLGEDAEPTLSRDDKSRSIVELIRDEIEPRQGVSAGHYDPGRIYEARSLYKTYLRRLDLATEYHDELGLTAADCRLGAYVVLPLVRALAHSFVPDTSAALALYADLLAHGDLSHASESLEAEKDVYASLIGLCVRQRLYGRALRLVRDMTIFGIEQLFNSGSTRALTTDHDVATPNAPLFLSRRARVDLLAMLMRSATSYAEAYSLYWRLRRLWAGVQSDALAQQLQERDQPEREQAGGGLRHWLQRFSARSSEPFAYLGEGVDAYGKVETSPQALSYWTRGLPTELDEDVMAHESILLTEDELMREDMASADPFQSSSFSLSSILGRLQSRPAKDAALLTIYASPQERRARLSASPFASDGWRYILAAFPNLPCGWVHLNRAGDPRRASTSQLGGSGGAKDQMWIPAPPELVTSIFWDMLQSGCSPPPHVYTELLHYYTRLVKASRQPGGHDERGRLDEQDRNVTLVQAYQRRLIAAEAVASLHKLIYLDVHLAPDLPLINALMNAFGHLGQIRDVLSIWQSLVELSGRATVVMPDDKRKNVKDKDTGQAAEAASDPTPRIVNRMDSQSVAIVLDACGFAPSMPGSPSALSRARKIVSWARHRDGLALARLAHDAGVDGPAHGTVQIPALLMSKGAWDAWLECLCRRGRVREAIEVFKNDMVPTLAEQARALRDVRNRIGKNVHTDGQATSEAGGAYEPDAKTVGMLLRFAARDRRGSASSHLTGDNGGLAVGSDLLGGGEGARLSDTSTLKAAAAAARARNEQAPEDGWSELRAWVRREMPAVWEDVRQVGVE